jgi:hypothetical protein
MGAVRHSFAVRLLTLQSLKPLGQNSVLAQYLVFELACRKTVALLRPAPLARLRPHFLKLDRTYGPRPSPATRTARKARADEQALTEADRQGAVLVD